MKYNIVVVGGGPGGAVAAKTCAEKGLSVLLIEKRRKIGDPVRCGELIPEYIVEDFGIAINSYHRVSKFEWISPEKQKVFFDSVSYMVDRRVFDSDLVSKAEDAGADVWLRARGKPGEEVDVESDIIVAADGVESQVGRMAGIDTSLKLKNIGSGASAVLKGVNSEEEILKNYYLRDFVPGYLWIFPKGENTANVGVILLPTRKIKPITLLEFYMKRLKELRGAEICYYTSGGVPEALRLEKLFFKNVLFVGDAARLSDPIGGGGIPQAMVTGKLAAETAVESIESDNPSMLKEYEKKWSKNIYECYQYELYVVKELFLSMDVNARIELVEKLWQTASQTPTYPFMLSNVMKQRTVRLKVLKILMRDNRLRKWAFKGNVFDKVWKLKKYLF
jgi:digeranylgeranylglycerophospholipid reductase